MTKLSLLSSLRRLLARPDTRVIERKLRECGQSTWTVTDGVAHDITILVDPRRDGRVRLVIHELLHIHMAALLGIDRLTYELEEAAVLAWEAKLYSWLHDAKRAAALESWNKSIERKMR